MALLDARHGLGRNGAEPYCCSVLQYMFIIRLRNNNSYYDDYIIVSTVFQFKPKETKMAHPATTLQTMPPKIWPLVILMPSGPFGGSGCVAALRKVVL